MKHFKALCILPALILAASTMSAQAVSPQMAGLIGKMKRDLGGAMEQTAVLRNEIDQAPASITPVSFDDGIDVTDLAGISDGGFQVMVAGLRRTSAALNERLAQLSRTYRDPTNLERSKTLLIMRMELTSLIWAIDELGREGYGVDRQSALARIDENLAEFDKAITASTRWN